MTDIALCTFTTFTHRHRAGSFLSQSCIASDQNKLWYMTVFAFHGHFQTNLEGCGSENSSSRVERGEEGHMERLVPPVWVRPTPCAHVHKDKHLRNTSRWLSGRHSVCHPSTINMVRGWQFSCCELVRLPKVKQNGVNSGRLTTIWLATSII